MGREKGSGKLYYTVSHSLSTCNAATGYAMLVNAEHQLCNCSADLQYRYRYSLVLTVLRVHRVGVLWNSSYPTLCVYTQQGYAFVCQQKTGCLAQKSPAKCNLLLAL